MRFILPIVALHYFGANKDPLHFDFNRAGSCWNSNTVSYGIERNGLAKTVILVSKCVGFFFCSSNNLLSHSLINVNCCMRDDSYPAECAV